jgi:hypothetical protein
MVIGGYAGNQLLCLYAAVKSMTKIEQAPAVTPVLDKSRVIIY